MSGVLLNEGSLMGVHSSFYDLFRVAQGKLVEHWDTYYRGDSSSHRMEERQRQVLGPRILSVIQAERDRMMMNREALGRF